ncbi:hypothetical protein CCP3SC5AM1_2890003 [Gammaproteobacteria bacterium]
MKEIVFKDSFSEIDAETAANDWAHSSIIIALIASNKDVLILRESGEPDEEDRFSFASVNGARFRMFTARNILAILRKAKEAENKVYYFNNFDEVVEAVKKNNWRW